MPSRPPRACAGCGALVEVDEECSSCRKTVRQIGDRQRGSSADRGYDREHEHRFRRAVLKRDPWCRICGVRKSVIADHWPRSRRQLEVSGDDPNDPEYGRGLCRPCDSKQTARRQPGGWNRRRKKPR